MTDTIFLANRSVLFVDISGLFDGEKQYSIETLVVFLSNAIDPLSVTLMLTDVDRADPRIEMSVDEML